MVEKKIKKITRTKKKPCKEEEKVPRMQLKKQKLLTKEVKAKSKLKKQRKERDG